MPRGENLKGKGGVKFSKDNQPTPENKSAGKKKVSTIKEALIFIAEQVASKKNTSNGEFEFSMEAEIIYKQVEKALKGDTKSAEFMAKIGGWAAPTKVEQNTKFDGLNITGFVLENKSNKTDKK